jgi:hypothetical protein
MEFKQNKLTKSEWESIEVPVSENEKLILNIIYKGFDDLNIVYNKNISLIDKMKLTDDNNNIIDKYLFVKYLIPNIKDLMDFEFNEKIKNIKIKKCDKIRIDNMDKNLNKDEIFEFKLIDIINKIVKNKKRNNNYYNLYNLIKLNVKNVNKYLLEYINYILNNTAYNIEKIIYNSYENIERNELLNINEDITLYDHQKKLFQCVKNNDPKLILYQAPTGTGKTISPVGLTRKYKVIFVCAAKHVGLQLAKSCISLQIPIAVAFGCNDPGDIRLHYYAAKDFVKNYKSGGIFKVDNSVGDKVELIICDIKSYLPSMNYMLAFEEKENIITYWDEPTITLDYKEHQYHNILSNNWKNNLIPNMVLSSATLPHIKELEPMICYFKSYFHNAHVFNIKSDECKKTIPIIDTNGYICLPHNICKNNIQLFKCMKHCFENKTLYRHFDLREIINFIKFIHKHKYININNEYYLINYFKNLENVNVVSIKEYYLNVLNEIRCDFEDIYDKYKNEKRLDSSIYITTRDSYTLTDGPTIYIAEDTEKLAKVLLKMCNIPSIELQNIEKHINYNNNINEKLNFINKELEDVLNKMNNDRKIDRSMNNDPKIMNLNKSISELSSLLKDIRLSNYYIPNKPEHLKRFNKNNVCNAYTSDIDQKTVEQIMLTSVDNIWKILLLLGIGVFKQHNDVNYLEIMKKLASEQKLYLIIASQDYIYGTNYQFCHCYIGKDLLNMTQEKLIQSFGRVGRKSHQMDYSIRLRNNDFIKKIYFNERNKIEVENMNKLFGLD